jgi:ribonuclease Z
MPPSTSSPSTTDSVQQGPVLALGFDQARMRIGDMWKMNYYLAAIEQSFADEEKEDQD